MRSAAVLLVMMILVLAPGLGPVDASAATLGGARTETLATYSGPVRNAERTLRTGFDPVIENGVSYIREIYIDVTSGATTADLVGARVEVAMLRADGSFARFGGVIGVSPTDTVRVAVDPEGVGDAFPTILIDPGAGPNRPRSADFVGYSVSLSTPQLLTAVPGVAPISLVAGALEGTGPTGPTSALEPIAIDSRLSYDYPPGQFNHTNGLSFCHTFSVQNTSDEPVRWSLTFDTSLPPLWGANPTEPGVLSTAYNFTTTSYDPATHRWTIAGAGYNDVIPPHQTVSGMGFCAQNVPQPPVDPSLFTWQAAVAPGSGPDWAQLSISVRSQSDWNVPWAVTIDLADYVCSAALAGRTLSFQQAEARLVPGTTTVYEIRGTLSNTGYVSASHPRDFVFVGFSPATPNWQAPCA